MAATALTDEGLADLGADVEGSDRADDAGDAVGAAVGDPVGGVAAGLQKRPRDLDLPPWLKGRYGTAIGRAVHGTLQTIDLATGAGLDATVAWVAAKYPDIDLDSPPRYPVSASTVGAW